MDRHATGLMASLNSRLRGEYCEMPGLALTPAQACRLFGLDLDKCRCVLETLTHEGFLKCTPRGVYVLASLPSFRAEPLPRPHTAGPEPTATRSRA